MTIIEKLTKFVNQRPGLDFANYGDVKSFRNESAEITRDRTDYFELLSLAATKMPNLNSRLEAHLRETNGRLKLNENGELEYCTGQYFPTEYRPAANRVLVDLIWAYHRDLKKPIEFTEPLYKDAHEIRKAIRQFLSRRVMKTYFK